MEKSYNFSNIRFADLEQIVDIRMGNDEAYEHRFDEWFEFAYPLEKFEVDFLEKLIQKHRRRLPSYSEEKLKMKFLSPILNQVDFLTNDFQDWYDSTISGFVNGVELKGFADMMVAKGIYEPEKPYFFIQEFKPSKPDRDPEIQLLAEMLVAIEKNNSTILRGSYIIGRNWYFVILEKISENSYEYFVSKQFDSLELDALKQIYINLQAVKLNYCKD